MSLVFLSCPSLYKNISQIKFVVSEKFLLLLAIKIMPSSCYVLLKWLKNDNVKNIRKCKVLKVNINGH